MKKSKETLKSYFQTGDTPTQSQFEDLIDSFEHKDQFHTNSVRFYIDETQISSQGSTWGRGNTDHLVDEGPISAFEGTVGTEILINNIAPVVINQYALKRDSASVATHATVDVTYIFNDQRVLSSWTVQGSIDGTNWDVLDIVSNFNFTLDTNHVFSFANETAYTFYKLVTVATPEVNGNLFLLSELELWESGTLRKNLENTIRKSETRFLSDNKFYNEKGIATLTPQREFGNVYIDADEGDDISGQLEDKNYPFKTYAAAKAQVDLMLSNSWVFNFLGNGKTYAVNKIPKCPTTFNVIGWSTTIDFSGATEYIYDHNTRSINIDNPNGTIKFHKSFSGNGYSGHNSYTTSLIINAKDVDLDSIDTTLLFGGNNVAKINIETLTIRGGYAFNFASKNEINIYEINFVAGGTTTKSIFKYIYGGAISINTISGVLNENCGIFYRSYGGIFTLGNLTDVEIEIYPFGGNTVSYTSIVWKNSSITNCYLVPHCNNLKWSGYIREIILRADTNGRKLFSTSAGSEGLVIDYLTIKNIRWDDNDPTRNTVLISDLYSGPKITINNLIIENSYVTFALIFSRTQADWDLGTHEPMKWYGMIAINMANTNEPLSIRNVSADATKYAKIKLFGQLFTKEGNPILKDNSANGYQHQIEIIKQISN